MNYPEPVKIIVVDDHPIFIEGVKKVLSEFSRVECIVVGAVNSASDFFRLFRHVDADLVLLDMNLPDMNGLEVLEQIEKRENKKIRKIVLTMYDDPKIVKAAFKAGTDGYVLKGNKILELEKAIAEVMAGNTFMGEKVFLTNGIGKQKKISERHQGMFQDRFIKKYHLTKRELEVLALISQAMSNKEIAKELYISDQTVSVHRKNIMRKLGVNNTAGLIKVAYDNSLV